MMKRVRTDCVGRFRRPLKNRTASRLGESMYFRFFSPHNNLIYLKFLVMWLGCIALDFIIGFRFELLWPVWLLIRHLYESFRVHAFSSSLHYSAFSVFFVCVTATSDLVCYLFIPIQVLIFLASTYVWVQFVYQSTDRGICLPSLCLWTLFLAFEYSMRYKFDATWYITRGSWLTAGLLPSTADSVSVGSASGSSPPPSLSPRLELYRPFAAHCLGFPIVTLGFRVKSFFSKWRLRVRKDEVMRQNEFFERILATAVPCSFDDRRHFISSRTLDLEQDAIDYELESNCNSEEGSGMDTRLYSQVGSTPIADNPLALWSASSALQNVPRKSTTRAYTKALAPLRAQQNGHLSSSSNTTTINNNSVASSVGLHRRNGASVVKSVGGNGWSTTGSLACTNGGSASLSRKAKPINRNKHLYARLWGSFLLRLLKLLISFVCSTLSSLYRICGCPIASSLGSLLAGLRGSDPRHLQQQDDLISSSGDGSHIADDESDQELHYQYPPGTVSNVTALQASNPKKKNRRTRGRTPLSSSGAFLSEMFGLEAKPQPLYPPHNGHLHSYTQNVLESREVESPTLEKYTHCNGKVQEESPREKDKQFSKEIERLRMELKNSKSGELELRSQLNQAQQQEKASKAELLQNKTKLEQVENKYKQLSKQTEHYKVNISALEKRMGEAHLKKIEVERELANERLSLATKYSKEDALSRQSSASGLDNNNSSKNKLTEMDRELKSLKKELRAKDEQNIRMEEELKLLRGSANKQNNSEIFSKQIELLHQKNSRLEEILSSENRLKQDLFRALNDSKAQIEALNVRLRSYEQNGNKGEDLFNSVKSDDTFLRSSNASSPQSYSAHYSSSSFCPSTQSSQTTPPPAFNSVLSLDASINAIMQATGAQHMSYSFGQLEENDQSTENNLSNETMPHGHSVDLIIGRKKTTS